MWFYILLLCIFCTRAASDDDEPPILYYYGLEESERSLPACGARQACSALALRYWRAPALVRLCRCPRRRRCHAAVPPHSRLEINNRAYLQFCQPIGDWPECPAGEDALTVISAYDRMNPDELEEKHHENVQLTPPNITFACRCREPNYWRLASRGEAGHVYRCSYLPLCKTGEFCGNVNFDLGALYQSCTCPKRHMCVHNGGVPRAYISELLYEGQGWKAYCQRAGEDYSYEEY